MSKVLTMAGSSFCGDSGLLTLADAAETVYDTTVIIPFCIEGKAYRKAAVTNGVTPTSDHNSVALANIAAGKGACLLFLLNAAGTVSVMLGDQEDWDDTNFDKAPEFPHVPDGTVPFAYAILSNDAGSSDIDIGTTDWNQAGTNVTVVNLMTMPERPQTS